MNIVLRRVAPLALPQSEGILPCAFFVKGRDSLNNRLTTVGCDGAGNVIADSRNNCLHDAEDRLSAQPIKRGLRGSRFCAVNNGTLDVWTSECD